MTDNLDAIRARIAALAAKTVDNGCAEAEAIAAMEAVGRLLLKYNLSMSEVEMRQEKCTEDYLQVRGKNINNNIGMLLSAVALFTDCKCYTWRTSVEGEPAIKYQIFGQESDVKLASYLLYVTTTAMLNEAHKFVKGLGVQQGGARSPSNSFQHGFALRIYRRLKEIKDSNNKEMTDNGSRALIVLKDQLVTEEWARRHDELGLKSRAASKARLDAHSYQAGQRAADAVNLNRPLTEGKAQAAVGRNKLLA